MRTHLSVSWHVVGLDWRLLIRACRAYGSDLTLPILLGAVMFAAFSQSAVATASVLAGRPASIVAPVLAVFVWNAFFAAAVLTVAVGGHSTAERIIRYLALEPITRWQLYTALAVLSLAGRQALVSVIVLVPVLSMLAGLAEPMRAAAAGLAMLLVLRLVPGVTRLLAGMAALAGRWLALICGVAGALAIFLRPGLEGVIAALPPSLVAQYAAGTGSAGRLWLAVAIWTLAVELLGYAVLSRRAESPEAPPGAATIRPIPVWIRGAARVAGISAPLLHGELLRLIRWRRFLAGWGVFCVVLAVVLPRITSLDSRILPTLLVALTPPFVAVATLGNLFAADRAGVQAFFLALDEPHTVIRAKVVAVALFVAAAEVIALGLFLAVAPRQWQVADGYTHVAVVAFYGWIASAGRITSTLFPVATDPRSIGGGLLRGPGALLLLALNGLALAGIVAPAVSYDTGRIGVTGLLFAGLGISVLVLAVARVASRVSNRAMSMRREELVATLGQEATIS